MNQGFSLAPYSSSSVWRLQTATAKITRLCLSQLPVEGLSWEKQDISFSHPVPVPVGVVKFQVSVVEKCVSGGSYSVQPPLREWRLYLGCGMHRITGTLTTFALAHEVVVPYQERQARRPQAVFPTPSTEHLGMPLTSFTLLPWL